MAREARPVEPTPAEAPASTDESSERDGWKREDLKMFKFLRGVLNHIDIAYVATYPPQECGIATFTRDLASAISKYTPFSDPTVVAVGGVVDIEPFPKIVKFQIRKPDLHSYLDAAEFLNQSHVSVVNVQHEYGIFGGQDGEYILEFLRRLRKPVVTTLHTVLFSPYPNQRRIVREIAGLCSAVVVMVKMGKQMLIENYGVPPEKIVVIRHGVPNVHRLSASTVKKSLGISDRPVFSSFGLINRGKGIEYAIRAMPLILEKHPDALYLVLGETHPGVRNYEGESYRSELLELVADLGLEQHVRFNNRYLMAEELINYLCATDVYITPYINRDQIVSGTLAYALGCGKAIVSTPYLYAEEVLSKGRGMLVEFRSPGEIAEAVHYILSTPSFREEMEARAHKYGRRAAWFNVAIDYLDLFHSIRTLSRGVIAVPASKLDRNRTDRSGPA
ncbi:MAG TPA: glycosyltransferase family 4 protein [Armatimonadota bacterium]|nr:glycosyltransferase family 4 protein [Armatimonadota bacterium]